MNDPVDCEALFDQCFEELYAYIAYRTAPDREAAQDITQDVFLAAVQARNSFRNDCSVLSWLRGIARNKIADHFRALALNTQAALGDLTSEPPAPDPELTDAQQQAALVAQALRRLPGNYAELLEEKYLEGFSVKQISQQHGQTEKAVESALTRARNAFREIYQRLQAQPLCEEINP